MTANSIFIDLKDFDRTGMQYALASTQQKQGFDSQHVNIDMLITDVQMMCNETANKLCNYLEQTEGGVTPIELRAEWGAYMRVLNELKGLKVV